MRQKGWILLIFLSFFLLSACSIFSRNNVPEQQEETTAALSALSEATLLPQTTPESNPSIIVTGTTQTLRVWVPPSLLVSNVPEEAAVLQTQIQTFATSQSELDIILEPKAVSGQGGIISYLRTGRNIAPAIMPDLIALPADQLSSVFTDGLIISLDTLIDPALIQQLYPAAQSYAFSNQQLAGYPFAITQLTHFAYKSNQLTGPFPTRWGALITTEENSLSIPLGGRTSGVLVLQLYLEAGGSLTNEAGQISLQQEVLTQVLNQLQNSTENDFLNITVSQGSTIDEMWDAYRLDRTTIILTTAESYLKQESLSNTAVAPISGIDAPLTPLVSGWAWAITASNESQQALASELLKYLTDPTIAGVWSVESKMLPANPAAFEQWSINEGYLNFIQGQLDQAEALPTNATLQLITLLQEAARSVITGSSTPQAAAETAVMELQE